MRLLGFERVVLQPAQSQRVTVRADPRLLARFNGNAERWHIAAGDYRILVGKSAEDLLLTADVQLPMRLLGT